MEQFSLTKIYRSMLEAARLQVSSNGAVSIRGVDGYEPFTVDKKRVVIPEQEQMDEPDWSNRLLFHPLQENLSILESNIQLIYRQMAFYQVGVLIHGLVKVLLEYASNTAKHKELTPQQSEYLSIPNFKPDGKTYEDFDNLLKRLDALPPAEKKKIWVNGFIRRSAVYNGATYARLCVVDFPLYQQFVAAIEGPKHVVQGQTFRKKDVLAIKSLFEFILPGIGIKDEFSNPSNSRQAPTTDALMGSLRLLMSRLNDTVAGFVPITDESDKFSMEWADAFVNVDDLIPIIRRIPQITSYEAPSSNKTSDSVIANAIASAPNTVTLPTPQPQVQQQFVQPQQQFVQQQPQQQPQPQPQQLVNVGNVPQPINPTQSNQPANGIFTMQNANPLMAMQQQQQMPVVKTPDGKIDFAATVQARSQLMMGASVNPFVTNQNPFLVPGGIPMQQQMQPQQQMLMMQNQQQQPPAINYGGMMIAPSFNNGNWYYIINGQMMPAQNVLAQLQQQQQQQQQIAAITNGAVPLSALPLGGGIGMGGAMLGSGPVVGGPFGGCI